MRKNTTTKTSNKVDKNPAFEGLAASEKECKSEGIYDGMAYIPDGPPPPYPYEMPLHPESDRIDLVFYWIHTRLRRAERLIRRVIRHFEH